ncbi:hypothetical protein FC961_05470 [Clostridium botulinum]|nr:hypothetical protein [Clostridium botulinum]NFO91304.1 hypothetical protein [Clostridium botulinum]
MKKGLVDGEIIEWNEEGIMTYWAECEVSVLKAFKEWNDQGQLEDEKKEPTIEELEKIKKIKCEK